MQSVPRRGVALFRVVFKKSMKFHEICEKSRLKLCSSLPSLDVFVSISVSKSDKNPSTVIESLQPFWIDIMFFSTPGECTEEKILPKVTFPWHGKTFTVTQKFYF